MPLSPREAFQIGFMLRCADEGLSPEQVQQRIEKTAAVLKQGGMLGDVLGTATGMAGKGLGALGALSVGVPLAGGAMGGYLTAKGQEEPVDDEDVKEQELLREYKRLARNAKEQTKRKRLLRT